MTDWQTPRTVEHRRTSLSFAVLLVDAFTGRQPEDDVTVGLESIAADPVVNASGYHCFLDLDPDGGTVTLTVDGGDAYVDAERTVVLADDTPADGLLADVDGADEAVDAGDLDGDEADGTVVVVRDPSDPVVVELSPTPAYRFPSSTTIVRGHVRDAEGDPVPDARVSLQEFHGSTGTTAAGEYALFVPVTAEDVRRRDGTNVVVVDGDGVADPRAVADGGATDDPTLEVTHPDFGTVSRTIEVNAGTRTVEYVTLE